MWQAEKGLLEEGRTVMQPPETLEISLDEALWGGLILELRTEEMATHGNREIFPSFYRDCEEKLRTTFLIFQLDQLSTPPAQVKVSSSSETKPPIFLSPSTNRTEPH